MNRFARRSVSFRSYFILVLDNTSQVAIVCLQVFFRPSAPYGEKKRKFTGVSCRHPDINSYCFNTRKGCNTRPELQCLIGETVWLASIVIKVGKWSWSQCRIKQWRLKTKKRTSFDKYLNTEFLHIWIADHESELIFPFRIDSVFFNGRFLFWIANLKMNTLTDFTIWRHCQLYEKKNT